MPDSVLLIDDDADVLRAVGMIFERNGYEVARELSAESGLAAYDRLRPEVVRSSPGFPIGPTGRPGLA